jgi:tetratricopeptide (TPR) repeat protein
MDGRNPDSPITQRGNWVATRDVGRTLCELGRFEEALEMVRSSDFFWTLDSDTVSAEWRDRLDTIIHSTRTRHLGALTLLGRMGEAKEIVRQELERRRTRADAPDADARDLNTYAWNLVTAVPAELRDAPRALEYANRALSLPGEDHRTTGDVHDTRARALWLTGEQDAAIDGQVASVESYRAGGPEAWDMEPRAVTTLVRYLQDAGRSGEARAAVQEAIEVRSEWLPEEPARRAQALRELGVQLATDGYLSFAEEPLRRAVAVAREARATQEIAVDLAQLAYVLGRGGRTEEAGSLAEEAWKLYRERWVREPIDFHPGLGILPDSDGERSWTANQCKSVLARAFLSAGKWEEAVELNRQVDAVRQGASIHPARLLSLQGRPEEAESEWRRRISRQVFDGDAIEDPVTLALYEGGLGRCLMEQGRWDEAEELLRRAHERLLDWAGTGSALTGRIETRLAACERRELDPWSPEGF